MNLSLRLLDFARRTNAIGLLSELRELQYESPEALRLRNQAYLENYFDDLRKSIPMFAHVEKFDDLPIIDKKFINEHIKDLINPNYTGKIIRKKTGGTTAEPLVYYTGTLSQSYLWAGIFLSWEAAGYKLGDKVAFLAGPSVSSIGKKEKIYYRLLNVTQFSAFDMTPETMNGYGKMLQQGEFSVLYAFSSAVHLLARHFLDSGRRLTTSLRGIVCTAEMLTPVMRADIEEAFGVPCYSQYGCHDAGVSAFECEHKNGFHLISTRGYAEVLPDGSYISTDLSNRVMFMPRNNTGDLVSMSGRSCPCGRGFPLLDEVLGRQNDMVVDARGVAIHSLYFMCLFRVDARISAFQITFNNVQLNVNLHIRPSSEHESSSMKAHYKEVISKTAVFPEVNILFNTPFKTLANGKHRFLMKETQ